MLGILIVFAGGTKTGHNLASLLINQLRLKIQQAHIALRVTHIQHQKSCRMVKHCRPVRRTIARHAVAKAFERSIADKNHAFCRVVILITQIIYRQSNALNIPVEFTSVDFLPRLRRNSNSCCRRLIAEAQLPAFVPAIAADLNQQLLLSACKVCLRLNVKQIKALSEICRQHPICLRRLAAVSASQAPFVIGKRLKAFRQNNTQMRRLLMRYIKAGNIDKQRHCAAAMHYMCGTLIQIVGIHCLQLYACKDLLREAQQRQQDI